ncbi:MAG TPA: prepilin-type N-terminal cleavage/methylation domain-containing protein [Steroidobacteraceae bacterium]|nr:prepilin-type N-terminal cleavage/methylation domain-containing protein [Steroidobacteraceae bacterium]
MSARRHRGFTLIEVVVAFAILAMSLGALYECFGGALRRTRVASQAELANLRATSLLSEFRGSRGLLPQPRSGRDPDGTEWKITNKPYAAEIAAQSDWVAEQVTVDVRAVGDSRRVTRLQSIEWLPRPRP